MSTSTISTCPFELAKCKGVLPRLSDVLQQLTRLAPTFLICESRFTERKSPVYEALKSSSQLCSCVILVIMFSFMLSVKSTSVDLKLSWICLTELSVTMGLLMKLATLMSFLGPKTCGEATF